jgi:hypothetical protein
MAIDNLEKVIPLLKFDSPDDFYYLQILQRKKENPHLGSNSRVIKNYYINSVEYLLKHYEEIKQLCEQFNARASLRLNRRSYEKVSYKAMVNIANSMANKEYSFIKKSYDRAVGNGHNDSDKTWVLDIDAPMTPFGISRVEEVINGSNPIVPHNKIRAHIPSKSGVHIITEPFDLREFRSVFPEIEVHKDNPTNLYIS